MENTENPFKTEVSKADSKIENIDNHSKVQVVKDTYKMDITHNPLNLQILETTHGNIKQNNKPQKLSLKAALEQLTLELSADRKPRSETPLDHLTVLIIKPSCTKEIVKEIKESIALSNLTILAQQRQQISSEQFWLYKLSDGSSANMTNPKEFSNEISRGKSTILLLKNTDYHDTETATNKANIIKNVIRDRNPINCGPSYKLGYSYISYIHVPTNLNEVKGLNEIKTNIALFFPKLADTVLKHINKRSSKLDTVKGVSAKAKKHYSKPLTRLLSCFTLCDPSLYR